MKKLHIVTLVMLMGLLIPALAEVRLDIGLTIPMGLGSLSTSGGTLSEDATDFFSEHIIPFPQIALYYQDMLGSFRLGGGIRAYSFILETIFWPNVFVEKDLWHFTVALQAGGGCFGLFGLYSTIEAGKVFIPDLSLWYRIGDSFRLGGGIMGLMVPELSDDEMLAIYYLGLNVALGFD
jgi:hypothetical protein